MKKCIVLLLCLLLVLPTAGCGRTEPETQSISLLCCSGYVPDYVLDAFTRETGIAVTVKFANSDADIASKVKANPAAYDVILAGDYVINELRLGNFLSPLDKSTLQNASGIDPAYSGFYYDPQDRYTVPLNVAAIVIAYNPKKTDKEITAFESLLDPALAKSVTYLDNSNVLTGICNLMLEYPVSSTEATAEIATLLSALSQKAVYADATEPEAALLNGTADIAVAFNSQLAKAMAENADLQLVYPKEGFIIAADALAVSAKSAHTDAATQLIDYLLAPAPNAQIMESVGGCSTVSGASTYMSDAFKNNRGYNLQPAQFKNGAFFPAISDSNQMQIDELYTQYFYNKVPKTLD